MTNWIKHLILLLYLGHLYFYPQLPKAASDIHATCYAANCATGTAEAAAGESNTGRTKDTAGHAAGQVHTFIDGATHRYARHSGGAAYEYTATPNGNARTRRQHVRRVSTATTATAAAATTAATWQSLCGCSGL